jgi:hypothetical protein
MKLAWRGRPRCVAVIDGTQDKAMFYYDKFYEACDTLSYSDCRALAYGLDISLRQVYNWRNRKSFPRIGLVLAVMDWVAAGKPTKLVGQREIMQSML